MKNFNLTQMLQGCSRSNEMTVSATNSGGGQTCQVKQQTRLTSVKERWSEKEALSSTCLRSASDALSFRSRYLRYAAVIFCVLMIGIGNAWGAATNVYLNGNFSVGNWNSYNSNDQFTAVYNSTDGKYYQDVYANGTTQYFRLWTNNHCGPTTNNTEMKVGDGGAQAKSYDEHNWMYKGKAGILRVCIDQTSSKDWNPWVWLERPTVYVRHKWNNSGTASNQAMTDNEDGTYKYKGQYSSSSSTTYIGTCSSCSSGGDMFKQFSSPSTVGSPTNGDWCLFEYNASGFRGKGGQSANKGTLTITKLYSITYDGNGKTSGSVPSGVSDVKWNVTTTVADNTGTLRKTGCAFIGWNTAKDGTGKFYLPGSSFTPTATSHTLYAQWLQLHEPGVYESSGGYNKSLKTYSGRDYEIYRYAETSSVISIFAGETSTTTKGDKHCVAQFAMNASSNAKFGGWIMHNGGISSVTSKASDNSAEFSAVSSSKGIKGWGGQGYFIYVSGYDQFDLWAQDKKLASNYYIKVYRDGVDVTANKNESQTVRPYTLDPSLSYLIRIECLGNQDSNGDWLVGFSLRLPPSSCTAPSALAAASPTAKGITLSVTDANDVNNYEFYVSTESTAPEAGATATHSVSSAKSLTITNLVAGTTYYAWARTKCSASNKSDWVALGSGGTFTTSKVTMTPTLTNVTKTSGATSSIGGSDYTAVFTANTGYSMPNPTVTIGGNAATSGTDYTWTAGTGTISIPANKINGNIVITLNSAAAAPSSVAITGNWLYFAGETIELTATPTGGNGPVTYQWYKGGKADGNAIDGATSATYTKASCAFADAGSYYCKVTCGGSESTWGQNGDAYEVKVPHLYVKTGRNDGVKSDFDDVDFTRVDASTATASMTLGANWDYCFNIADGCGHYYGNAGTMQYNNYGPWTTNVNNQDCGLRTTNGAEYVFTIDYSNWEQLKTTITFPSSNQAADKVIYFDNNDRQWSNLHYRIGRGDHTQAAALTLVPGTANLYKYTTVAYNNFAGWHIANNAGWTGSNTIYRTYTNGDAYSITYATAHEGGAVTESAVTVTPTTSRGMGGDAGINDNCEFYNYTITNGMKTQNVAISPYSNGTITVNYTNTSNVASTLTSGNADLAHSVILTSITAVPNTGYDASAITINGGAYSANYVVTGETTIAASFTATNYTIAYDLADGSVASPNPTNYTIESEAITLNNPTKTGYTFAGWTGTGLDAATTTVTIAAGSTGNRSYTATWTEDTHTVSVAAGAHGTVSPSSVSGVGIATASGNITATPSTGYNFSSWDLPSGVTAAAGKTASSNPIQINATADDKTITATWTLATYSITYDLHDGGAGSLDGEKTSYHITDEDYDLPTPEWTGHTFLGWYATYSDGVYSDPVSVLTSGSTGNKTYHAKWADGVEIVWTITKVDSKLYKGGTGYSVKAVVNNTSWTGHDNLVLSASDGVTLGTPTKSTVDSKAQIVADFSISGSLAEDAITFSLYAPATGVYAAIEDEKEVELDECPGGSVTSVYKFQVKTGMSSGNIDRSVTDGASYLSVLEGGTLPIKLESNGHIAVATDSLLSITSTNDNAYLKPTLTALSTIQRGDLIQYRIYSSEMQVQTSTTYSSNTDIILSKAAGAHLALTTGSMAGQSSLYLKKSGSSNSNIAYFEIIRPSEVLFYAEVGTSIGSTNISDGEQTTSTILDYISGGKLYTHASSSGKVKGATNEIQLTAGDNTTYIKLELNKELAAGDIIITYSTTPSYPLGITTSATRSTTISGTYTIPAESGMIGESTIYLWRNSSNTNMRRVAVVRPGGTGGEATSLAWSNSQASGATVNKDDVDGDFRIYASPTPSNAGGPISYTSSNESVATVSSDGTVHIVNDGSTTITASMPAFGCYSAASSITYSLVVANTCSDTPGTIVNNDGSAIAGNAVNRGACEALTLRLTGHSGSTIQWKKGDDNVGTNSDTYTVPTGESGVYTAVVTGDCPLEATNSITVTTAGSVDPTIFADEFTVKQGHWFGYRLMEINAGESVSVKTAPTGWVNLSDFKITTKNNIVSIEGNVRRSIGDKTLTLTITNECGGSTDKDFTIHEIAETAKPTVAWIATGDNKGADYLAAVKASESTNTGLYKELENYYTITPRNCYWTTSEAELVKEYSQYDLIILTDYPNSQTGPSGKSASKSYTNALGLLKDHKPMLTFEAYVAQCPNWEIPSNPQNTSNTQNDITLLCNADEIFNSRCKFAAGSAISVSTVGSGQALQGFLPTDAPFVFIGSITDGGTTYIACCERQVNPAARMMIFGLNANTMNNLTSDGKEMVRGFINYLLISDAASIPDCSVIFNGGAGADQNWNTAGNWEGGTRPGKYASVRIDKPCVVSGDYVAEAGYLKIHTSSEGDTYTGKLTIASDGVMAIDGTITRVEDNEYTVHKRTQPSDVVIEATSSGQGALIFNNESARTQATVQMYSKAHYDEQDLWQYVAVPLVSASRWNMGDWAFKYDNASQDWSYYEETYYAFDGIGLTQDAADTYEFEGELASTTKKTIPLYPGDNLVGNSWTAPIHIVNFDEDKDFGSATATVFIYETGHDPVDGATNISGNTGTPTPGKWHSIPIAAARTAIDAGTWNGMTVIPAMQAFEVKTTSNTSLTLNYDQLVRDLPESADTNEPLHAPRRGKRINTNIPIMRVTMSDSTARNDVYLFSGEQFSEGFDNGWDGEFLTGESRYAQLYAMTPNGNLAISAQPEMDGTVLGFVAGASEQYTMTFRYIGDETLYLNDMLTQTSTLIDDESEYMFTAQAGERNSRFVISSTPFEAPQMPTGVENVSTEAPKVRKLIINDKVYIIRNGRIYGADGHLVK